MIVWPQIHSFVLIRKSDHMKVSAGETAAGAPTASTQAISKSWSDRELHRLKRGRGYSPVIKQRDFKLLSMQGHL